MTELNLFLDDERFPVSTAATIARTTDEAIALVMSADLLVHVSFDHDLGDGAPTGFDFAKWLVERDMDLNGMLLTSKFSYYVHSANPVGAANIRGLLDNYLTFKQGKYDEEKEKAGD